MTLERKIGSIREPKLQMRAFQQEGEISLAERFKNPNLNKEQLRELMNRVGRNFFLRNRELFVALEDLVGDKGYKLRHTQPSKVSLPISFISDAIVGLLKIKGEITVGIYHIKSSRKSPENKRYFISALEHESASTTMDDTEVKNILNKYCTPS